MKRIVAAVLAPAFEPRLRAVVAQLVRVVECGHVERAAVIGPVRGNVFAGMPVVALPAHPTRPLVTALGWALRASCDGVLLVDAAAHVRVDLDALVARFERGDAPAVGTRVAARHGLPAIFGVPLFARLASSSPSIVLATTRSVPFVPGTEIADRGAPGPWLAQEANDLTKVA